LINSKQEKELESSFVLARLTVALKTEDIAVTIYSKERTESTIEVKFKNREQEIVKFMYPVKNNVVHSSIHSIHETLEELRMRLKAGEILQSVLTHNL
jgi:hypothetical protein